MVREDEGESTAQDLEQSGVDERKRGWYWGVNEIVTQYGALLGPLGIALYDTYVVYTDRREESPHKGFAFPTMVTQQNFFGVRRQSIRAANKVLDACGLIVIEKRLVPRTKRRGDKVLRYKAPVNHYRAVHKDDYTLTYEIVMAVLNLALEDDEVYGHIRHIFAPQFRPITRKPKEGEDQEPNPWYEILPRISETEVWSTLEARAAAERGRRKKRARRSAEGRSSSCIEEGWEQQETFGRLMTKGSEETSGRPTTNGPQTFGRPTTSRQIPSNNKATPIEDVVAALSERHLSEALARQFAEQYPELYLVEKIDYHDFGVEEGIITENPAGWLRLAIEEGYGPPAGYVPRGERDADVSDEDPVISRRAVPDRRREILEARGLDPETIQEHLELWRAVLDDLELQMTKATFNTWCSNTLLLEYTGDQAVIGTTNEYAKEWLESRLRAIIQRTLNYRLDREIQVSFEVCEQEGNDADGDDSDD